MSTMNSKFLVGDPLVKRVAGLHRQRSGLDETRSSLPLPLPCFQTRGGFRPNTNEDAARDRVDS